MDWKTVGIGCIKAAIKALKELKEVKALNDDINIQTNADLVSHQAIINFLKKRKVKCNVFSEEEKIPLEINGGNKEIIFVADPIDNTQLYLRGEISFCSVALMILIGGRPEYSFVGDISNGNIYHCNGKYAYCNDKPIRVPARVQGRNIILGWAPYQLRMERLFENLKGLTKGDYYLYNFGGQLQTVKIAIGSYDAYLEVRGETLNEFCAAVIVERAGGVVSTLQGKPVEWDPKKRQTLLVSRNNQVHQEILSQFKDKNYED